ncbi:MAG: LysM peptidoglycan-binding domain-containing protein [Trueperella sp.]|nr:LysM peptidoglycan-binding domain-containing protein [Trueperella sp.]
MQSRSRIKRSGTAIAAATAVGVLAPAVAQAAPVSTPVVTGNLAAAARLTPQLLKAPVQMTYQVKRGDTVWAIAQRTGTSVSAIISANSLSSRAVIYPGQRLVIPGKSTPVTAQPAAKPAPAVKPAATPSTVYVVKSGDTLSAIAQRFGTSVSAIAKANSIANPNRIAVGQRLTIGSSAPAATKPAPSQPAVSAPAAKPAPAVKPAATPSTVYVVKSGDTLSAIAQRFGTSVSAIAKANSIANPNRIAVGQRLNITGSATVSSQSTATKPAAPTEKPLVTNNFPGYTYPDATVAAANANKQALIAQPVPSRAEIQQKIIATANALGVDPRLALAHAYVESGFDATAVSPANAIGTMQVIPSSGVWASQLVGRSLNLLNPDDNITAGVAIIRSLQKSATSLEEGIAGYYQGLSGVQRYGMRSDTVKYVAKVKAAMARF